MPESCCPSRSKYHNDALSYCVRSVWVHTRCTAVEPLTLWIRWLRLSHLGHKVLVVQKCYHPAMSPSSIAVAQCLSLVLRDLWEKSSSRSCSALVQDSNPSTCWLDPHRRRTAKLVSRSSSITKLVLKHFFFFLKIFFGDSCWNLCTIIVTKKNFPPKKVFDIIRREQPESLKKLIAMEGDVTLPSFGLSPTDLQLLIDTVSVVFNSAATVRFDEDLKTAIEMNVKGPRRLLEICRQMKQLEVRRYIWASIKRAKILLFPRWLIIILESTERSSCLDGFQQPGQGRNRREDLSFGRYWPCQTDWFYRFSRYWSCQSLHKRVRIIDFFFKKNENHLKIWGKQS